MENTKTLNMTEGSITKLLVIFSLPMLIGNIFQQVYNLVDSIIVSHFIGASALGAIGATSSVTFLFFALCNGISSGGGIITSQAFGSGDESKIKRSIFNTAAVMLIMPAIVGVTAFIFSDRLLILLDTPSSIYRDSLLYTRTMCIGLIFVSVYNFVSSSLRALGDSKSPLYFLILGCTINTGLDLLFVLVFDMGVFGAGIATIISQFITAASSLIYAIATNSYFRLTKQDMKLDGQLIYRIVRLGIPLSLQFSLIAISCMELQRIVNSFGDVTVSAFSAVSRIEQMLHLPYQTLSAALATFSGQNHGAGKNERVIKGYRKSLAIMAIFTAIMLPIIQFLSAPIIRILVDEAEVVEMAARAIRISSLFYIFLGTIYVVRGVLNGLGDASFSLINGLVEVIGRFTVPVFLVGIPLLGVWGIWWSVGFVWFFSGFTAWLRYLVYKRRLGLKYPAIQVTSFRKEH